MAFTTHKIYNYLEHGMAWHKSDLVALVGISLPSFHTKLPHIYMLIVKGERKSN